MQTIALDAPELTWLGALDADRSEQGTTPRRLPAWARPQIPDVFTEAMVTMASGVRIAFRTDATAVELDVNVTSFRMAGREMHPAAFQLVVDDGTAGEQLLDAVANSVTCFVLDPLEPANLSIEPGGETTIRFDGLPAGDTRVDVWLPQGATVEVRALRVDDGASIAPIERDRRRWVHYGSSISHCLEADVPTGTWPAIAARRAGVELRSLGLGGQCQLDPFVARTIRDVEADLISLKLGINIVNADSMRERTFVPAVHGLLDTIREGHPATPILVVSPITCPVVEDHPGPTLLTADRVRVVDRPPALAEGALTLTRIRHLLAELVAARRALGDEHLHFLEGTALFGPDDVADLPDGLHPNSAGYARMGERFASIVFGPGGVFAAEGP